MILKIFHIRYLAIVLFLFNNTIDINAQVSQVNNDFISPEIPASPLVSEFTKYGDFPVSLNSGVIAVNVPLGKLKGHKLDVNLGLSYHASGIKVTDVASRVGLGWVLNAGGVISRNVRGLPDETPNNGYWDLKDNGIYDFENDLLDLTNTSDYTTMVNVARGTYDGHLDIYSFNFPEGSGKFWIKRIGNEYELVFIEESDFKGSVDILNGHINSFRYLVLRKSVFLRILNIHLLGI